MDNSRADSIVDALTIDVEDYFHASALAPLVSHDSWDRRESRVCRNTERILRLLDDSRTQATFFVLGWVAERCPALVRAIDSLGHEVASHSHQHRLVYDMTPDEFREDLCRSKHVLEDLTGKSVLGYRAPSFSVTTRSIWAIDVLLEEGFQYDSSIFPIWHDRYGIPSAPRYPHVIERPSGRLAEAPPSTIRIMGTNLPIAGGGYLRQLPYAWTRYGISRLHRADHCPAIVYVHPWEIDPEQPRLPAPLLTRLRHYRNLHTTEARLRALLGEFCFAPLCSVLKPLMNRGTLVPAA